MEQVNIGSDIGKTLRKYRRERGITQEELAVALNMGRTTISAYENGQTIPTPDIVSQLMAEMSKERPTSWADTGFGPWLKDELKVRGLSNNWLADQTGIALSTVDRYISGKSHPTSRLANEIERKLLWYDEDPEARRTVKRKADRYKKRVEVGISPRKTTAELDRYKKRVGVGISARKTTAELDSTAIYPQAIASVRRRLRVGRKVTIPVRSIDPENGWLPTLKREQVTVTGNYAYVAVFRRKNGMRESYTWQELVKMGV